MFRLGLIAPVPFVSRNALEYDGEWLVKRAQLGTAVRDSRVPIDTLRSLAVEFVDLVFALYRKCWQQRNELPALELTWQFVKPPLGGTRSYRDVFYRSPSLVLELCGALLLLLGVQMKREETASELVATLTRLHETVALHHVVPEAEAKCLHPALLSPHFYSECVEPLVLAHALRQRTTPATTLEYCHTAAALASSATALDTVAHNAPPLMCNAQDRADFLALSNTRRTEALVCAARALALQARAMRADGQEAERREKFILARTLLQAALALSPKDVDTTAALDEILSFTKAICIELGPVPAAAIQISMQSCDENDRELSQRELISALEARKRCALDWDGSVLRIAMDVNG